MTVTRLAGGRAVDWRNRLNFACLLGKLTDVTRRDQARIKECRDLLGKGQWEAASRVLEEVTQAGQSTLQYEIQVCAVLQAAGLEGHIKEVARRLDR